MFFELRNWKVNALSLKNNIGNLLQRTKKIFYLHCHQCKESEINKEMTTAQNRVLSNNFDGFYHHKRGNNKLAPSIKRPLWNSYCGASLSQHIATHPNIQTEIGRAINHVRRLLLP